MKYNTFILSNCNYCRIIWHSCGKTCTKKIEAIQEKALRFMFNDTTSTYSSLLEKYNYTTLHIRHIKAITSQVMLVNSGYSDLNHQNVKSWQFFIDLVTGHFVYMCHCKILFDNNVLKIGHKGRRSRSISILFDIPTLRPKRDTTSNVRFPVTLHC